MKKIEKFTKLWKVKNTHLNNQWIKEKKITREVIKYLEMKGKERKKEQERKDNLNF